MSKRTPNQFVLTAALVSALHLSYIWSHTDFIGYAATLPLLIDFSILLVVFGVLMASRWAASRIPITDNFFLYNLTSTLVFFLLGVSAFLVIVYTAFTGDRFSITLIPYFIEHAAELFSPIVAETGYLAFVVAAILTLATLLALHHAHLLTNRHLLLIFLLFFLAFLSSNTMTTQKNIRFLAFFSPEAGPYVPPYAEREIRTHQPWFKSLYLTFFGWDHAAYRSEENAEPLAKFSDLVYQKQTGNRPNIVFIVLESVRASATSPYNASLLMSNLTPNLQWLSQSAMMVESAYSTVPHTSKALIGIFCGQFPRKEMEITEAEPQGLPVTCIPNLLSKAGYKTAFFQSAIGEFENRHGLTKNLGFQDTYTQEQLPNNSYKKLGYLGMDDHVMVDPAINWMKSRAHNGQPFFLGMLTVVSHHPYATPGSNRVFYSEDQSFLNDAYSAYLAAVSYTDRFIGAIIQGIEKAGVMNNTIVIITGDHGEAFSEHGPMFHNGTPHEEGMKVPLLLYSPSLFPNPKRIDGLRSHLDLLPTILELTGIQASGESPGKSLLTTTGHESLSAACWYDKHCAIHIKNNGEKYIYWYGRKPNEFYQLRNDPEEAFNLIGTLDRENESQLVRSAFSQLNGYQTVYPSPHPILQPFQ